MDKDAIIKALRDTAQSASNTAAGTVSGPVDLIAAALRYGGIPVPQNAFGGSKWMGEQGLIKEVEQGIPRAVGETLGMVTPALATQFAPQIAGAINKGAANLAAPTRLNKETGAIVWHGSPHKFDRFDSSKIGTGEGAQAYGHGLYLAEAPEVAGEYARMGITGPAQVAHVGKKSGPDGAIQALKIAYPNMPKAWYESAISKSSDAGSLYKVDLPDDQIAKMLDWDKPLSQQAPEVRMLAKDLGISEQEVGAKFYQALTNQARDGAIARGQNAGTTLGASQAAASDDLRAFGIPGIRYLDGGSRGTGAGTSNFVVFPGNENILSILERNGQPLGLMGIK